MQHRYKINASTEARKSSTNTTQSHKTDTLSYINMLDKCTQILREDRIWVRNQLKANDQDILKIFKEAKRPINLQHLQIKLRKHVTAVKSKAKMQQLMKFKQNMHLGDWVQPQQKLQLQSKKETTKYQLPSGLQSSNSQSRGLKARMNNSVDKQPKTPMIYPYRNTSANSKKTLETYPAPMEQITQRESQNMTSARNRVYGEEANNDNYPFSHSYQQWRRPEQSTSSANGSSLQSNFINDPFKPKAGPPPSSNTYFNNFIGNEQPKQKPVVSTQIQKPCFQQSRSPVSTSIPAKKQNNSASQMKKSTKIAKEPEEQYQQYSPHRASRNDYSHHSHQNDNDRSQDQGASQIISHSYLEEYSPNQYQAQVQGSTSTNFLDSLNINCRGLQEKLQPPAPVQSNYKKDLLYPQRTFPNQIPKPVSFDETDLLHSKNSIVPFSSNTNSDSLFTSPELLAECRNFLKLKSSAKPSIEKDFTNSRLTIERETKFEPLKFDNVEPVRIEPRKQTEHFSNLQGSTLYMINQINCGMTTSIAQPQQIFTNQTYTSSFSKTIPVSMPSTETKITKQPAKIDEGSRSAALQEYFHTFAALSSQKKPEQSHQLITPEQFVDSVFNSLAVEPDGFVYWSTLQGLAKKKLPLLVDSFRQYLYPTDDEKLVLISNIGRLLQDLMPQNRDEVENDARNVYKLLDIEQKGYIVQQDIQDFLRQLQDSEAEDLQVISQYIWKLFETIDQDAQQAEAKRIDYWGIYSKKNSREFQELNQILRQFQFQIE